MIKLRWALLCQRVIVDAESNLISYIDALEGFDVMELPFEVPPLLVCMSLSRDDGDPQKPVFTLRALDPDDNPVLPEARRLVGDFGDAKALRFNVQMRPFEITKRGRYQIVIDMDTGSGLERLTVVTCDVV